MANLWFLLLLLLTAVSRTASQTCNTTIVRNYNGTIESPGFPDEYYGDQNCVYSFQFSLLGTWQINFTFFNLPNTLCDTDYLEVYVNSQYQRYCNNSTPPDLTNIYKLRFVSSLNASAGYGFQARVSMVLKCGITDIRLKENTPYSLYYNYFEPVQGRCEWTVTADQGLAIMMVGYTNSPNYEYIKPQFKMYKGTTKDQSSLIIFKTRNNEFALDEASNTILIEYIANGTFYFVVSVTFMAYNSTQSLTCGSVINAGAGEGDIGLNTNESQYIRGYYKNRICVWTIEAEESDVIQLVIRDFNIQTAVPGCNDSVRSYLAMYDGSQTNSSLLVRTCSYDEVPLVASTTRRLVVVLTLGEDFGFTNASFAARYKSFNKSVTCDWIQQNSSGWIQSPRFPADYLDNMKCSYVIQAPNNQHGFFITFTFYSFDLQDPDSNGSCIYDYLEILQVLANNSAYIIPPDAKKFCGKGPTQSLTTYFPTTLQFVSDNSITKGGFNISFVQTMAGCGESLFVGEEGFLFSPNHPGTFPPNLNCTTTIRVRPGHNITLTFESFFLGEFLPMENGSDCWRQSRSVLEIYDNILSGPELIGIYCGYELPRPITSTSNELTLIFRSTSNDYATGYNATYVSTSTMADDCDEPDCHRGCFFVFFCHCDDTKSVPSLRMARPDVTKEIKCILGWQEKQSCPPKEPNSPQTSHPDLLFK